MDGEIEATPGATAIYTGKLTERRDPSRDRARHFPNLATRLAHSPDSGPLTAKVAHVTTGRAASDVGAVLSDGSFYLCEGGAS